MNSQEVIRFLSVLTLASNAALGIFILFFLATKIGFFKKQVNLLVKKILPYALWGALIVSLTATLGSLYLSEIAGFEPCKLCWLQRIFMYPLPFIFGIAIYKKLKVVWQYALPLALTGAFIALYHYYFQVTGNPLVPCSSVGFSVSCSERFFTHFGYITIPWMSASAFTYIFLIGLISKKSN